MLDDKRDGYATATYKIKLYTKHLDWLQLTKRRYNQVLDFYYRLLLTRRELLELSNHQLLRQLEILSIGEKRKSGGEAQVPIPYEKVPLYFRRAAINGAIAMVRSQAARNQANAARRMNASPVYYQGMYKEFKDGHILLKLWNGKSWVWVKYACQNTRKIPEQAKCLSPSIKVNRRSALLHVPVAMPVEDVRTVKERIRQGEKVCAAAFPNNKNLAVCAILDGDGRFEHAFFIKGGAGLKHRRKHYLGLERKRVLEGRKKSQEESLAGSAGTGRGEIPKLSVRTKEKIHHLTENYAHKASREIVNYCVEHGVKIMVVPKYRESLGLNQKGYIPANDYDWIGRRIIRYLKYKAFQAGIAVTEAPPRHSASHCCKCGARIRKYNEGYAANINFYGGQLYECPAGHRGNTALNSAGNLLRYFKEKLVYEDVS